MIFSVWGITIPRCADRLARFHERWPEAHLFKGFDYQDLACDAWGPLGDLILPQAAILATQASLWKHLLGTTTDEHWLIVEDDAIPGADARQRIAAAIDEAYHYAPDWDILKAYTWNLHDTPRFQVSPNLYYLQPPDFVGTVASVYRRKALERACNEVICSAADVFLTRFQRYAILPRPVTLAPDASAYPRHEVSRQRWLSDATSADIHVETTK